jgi:hypothetical protein
VSTPSWDNRRLCDDGACTGLIGADGVCRVCGKAVPFWGDERRRGMQEDPADGDGDGDGDAADDEAARAARSPGAGAGGDDDDAERALCPDGSCTGLLDADGRCKVCGKVDPDAVIAMRKAKPGGDAGDPGGDDSDGDSDGDGDGDGDAGDAGAADGDDDADRRLCPDGACTGLLGSDGTCKVCGRSAEG